MAVPPQVRIVIPGGNEIKPGAGSKVFINGIEFENLEFIGFGTGFGANDLVRSTITLTFAGDILVERDG